MLLGDRWLLILVVDLVLRIVQLEALCWISYATWLVRKSLLRELENLRSGAEEVAPPGGEPCAEGRVGPRTGVPDPPAGCRCSSSTEG
jgi:hypothetical protein